MSIPVKVYNNLTRSKVDFKTLEEGKVKFYSCGPTTYDFLHVGNARALVVGDLFNRVLTALGYEVNFVRNFTDVDDKIINRAKELGVSPLEHSAKYVDECIKDMNSLGMKPATSTPKVSETMVEIIAMVQTLLDKGFAYEVNGEVLYHVPQFKEEYGKLSKKDLDSLQHGVRVEVDKHKKHPSDFVLWKPAKADEEEAVWDSPWGKGRPGWHIECSAMAKKFLGDTIDIHHGGIDLMFPHHENEIAQSEAANGVEFSKHWCHNEFLNFGQEKMSKSLGNVVTIRKFIETFSGEVLRQILISVHYRSVMDWSEDVISRAISDVERIHLFTQNLAAWKEVGELEIGQAEVCAAIDKMKSEMANDFNIPGAMAHFFSVIRLINREYISKGIVPTQKLQEHLAELISFVKESTGLVYDDSSAILEGCKRSRRELGGLSENSLSDEAVEALIQERKDARMNKDWAKADKVRDQLKAANIIVKDSPAGPTTWTYGKK